MMQHNEAQYAVECLLHAHSVAIERVRVLCRSPGRHWIHQQSCEALTSTYKQALQKLTNMLTASLLSHQLNAHQFHLLVQPALDMILAAILQGEQFLKSCRPPSAQDIAAIFQSCRASSSLSLANSSASYAKLYSLESSASYAKSYSFASNSDGEDAVLPSSESAIADVDKFWLQRALIKGHAIDAMDVHLHDFMIAFSAVGAAIDDLNVQYSAQTSTSKITTGQPLSPDLFWREQRNPCVLLVSAQQLDYVKLHDETVLTSQLEQVVNLRGLPNDGDPMQQQSATTSTMATDDAAQLATFVKEKMRCAKQAFQESLGPGFLDINQLELVDTITDSFSTSVHKVMWLGRQFALKVYKKAMGEAFLQEAKLHVRLHHPNVVHAVALFKGDQKGYGILIELMDETLTSFLQRHACTLRLQDKVSIMLQIAKGMAYVHGRGVMHRDLKPLNVLVRSSIDKDACGIQQLEVKVADFGESRSRLPNSSSFKTKKVGTTVYRAPEVLNDDRESLNFTLSYRKSADVYSFAMTCFELLAEKEPFDDTYKNKALWDSVVEGERPDLESMSDAACPPYLKHCLTTWWAEDPKTRHSFTHICCVLRHLCACLARCQRDTEPIVQFPFLAWPFWRWKKAQNFAQEELDQFGKRRADDDWKDKGYLCECTRVNEIPYEMYVMNWAIKKAADESEEAAYNAQSQNVPDDIGSIHNYLPNQRLKNRRFGPSHPKILDRNSNNSNVKTQVPAATALHVDDNNSTSGKSFEQKLKEFFCFSANIMPSNHEAFRDDIRRRNR